jgi:sec-independent protein translocase protein TatC
MNWVLLKPAASVNMELQNLRPFGQAFLYFKVVIMAGLIISMPYTLYQLWKFIAPGLYEKERRWAGKITIYTSFCFLAGVAFAYWIMIPVMLSFTASFGSSLIKNSIDVTEYFSFITTTLLSAGLIFELPMIAYILSKIGIISPEMLRKYRRHSIVVILVLAAALTPSTDPVSQLVFAAPLWVLYEISILVTVFARKKEESVTSIE